MARKDEANDPGTVVGPGSASAGCKDVSAGRRNGSGNGESKKGMEGGAGMGAHETQHKRPRKPEREKNAEFTIEVLLSF